ncbi:glutathione hydrolase 6 [Rhinatrema bivittatum]|uniref:glutathione hydrolase 6 n=1 Tax=Rhinatrema bivittatum TaxID=194408 RepID=UPI00112CBEED|nr:glutathione hydrolase 6 [Rhinatrema bivittatum]
MLARRPGTFGRISEPPSQVRSVPRYGRGCLRSPSARQIIHQKQRQTCCHVSAALLLLAVALSFAFYEILYGGLGQTGASGEGEDWDSIKQQGLGGHRHGEEEEGGGQHHHEEEGGGQHHHEEEGGGQHHHEEEGGGQHHHEEEGGGQHHHEEEGGGQHHHGEEEGGVQHHHGEEEEEGGSQHHHGEEEEEGGGQHHHEEEGGGQHRHGEEEKEEGGGQHHHGDGVYHHATVITDSVICSDIGKGILKDGGNIIDAGISATLCLGIIHPHVAGIGGVFSAIFHNATSGITVALNSIPSRSLALAYGVPLTLQGLRLLHRHHGQLGWSELLERTAQLSKDGFHVDPVLAQALRENEGRVKSSALRDLFCYANGTLKGEGSLVVNAALAEVLRMAGSMMAEAALPEDFVKHLTQDLPPQERAVLSDAISASRAVLESPLDVELDGFRLYGAPSPAAGNILADILKEVSQRKDTLSGQGLSDTYYQILNASRHAYIKGLREDIHWNASSQESSRQTTSGGNFPQFHSAGVGSHLSTADSKGNVFMISTSLNSSFGSYVLSPSTGIILSDFTLGVDSKPLFWACPVVVKLIDEDDDDVLGVGAAGGSSVPLSIAQVLINRIYFKKPLQDATSGPFLQVVLGDDGVPWSSVPGAFNSSSLFASLQQREPGVGTSSILLVEAHAEHVRAFGSPPQCCPSSGL